MTEIMGSGVALIDYDNDGDQDIFLLQGHPSAGSNVLLRNDKGTFTGVTKAAGLEHSNYGMGAATGDFDNDGRTDLLITAFNGNTLYRNNGNGTFTNVTPAALVLPNLWSTSAAFFDYDNDGWQDLVILNYIDFQFANNKRCQAPTGEPDYCTPRAYRSLPSHLFHNEKGKFVDVTAKSGFDKASGPALGVVTLDANNDGFQDVFIANDSSANHLWINNRNGTFTEKALELGVAYSESGLAKAGMGVALGDYNNDGHEDLIVVNLMREGATLFANNGKGDFADVSARTGLHNLSFLFTGFGVGWLDIDCDGRLDIFIANGAVTRREEQRGQKEPFKERNLLLRQVNGRFESIPIGVPAIHRAAAFGDIDNDGRVDIVVTVNNGQAFWYRNEGAKCNTLPARTAYSYLSASEKRR
ncbi:MAG: VCBS repeat-containing protein [Acidobacteria bacterium]|nr:VCBS repeat-containing protein [Acidobacteriota bacterium]